MVAALGAAVITGSVIENTVADGAFRAAASMATTTTASATVVPVPVVAPAISATSASLAAPVTEATTVAAKPTATAFSKALSVALPIAAGTAVAAGALCYFVSWPSGCSMQYALLNMIIIYVSSLPLPKSTLHIQLTHLRLRTRESARRTRMASPISLPS